jgi:hypothetical protein
VGGKVRSQVKLYQNGTVEICTDENALTDTPSTRGIEGRLADGTILGSYLPGQNDHVFTIPPGAGDGVRFTTSTRPDGVPDAYACSSAVTAR